MEENTVLIEKGIHDGKVWLITIDRPKSRNAVDGRTAKLLATAFVEFEKDPTSCVCILYGSSGNFCAGADLKAISTNLAEAANPLTSVDNSSYCSKRGPYLDTTGPMGPSRMLLSKPVIAAVSGFAVAGGLELACWCDLRVADETSIFGVFCRRFGVPLIDGGNIRLPLLIGQSRALDMILTGRAVSADEAYQFGLVNRLINSKQYANKDPNSKYPPVIQEAITLAMTISEFPQDCMRTDRMSVYTTSHMSIRDALRHEFEFGFHCAVQEGVNGATRFKSGQGRHGADASVPRAKL